MISLGREICFWIEDYLVHGPGDVQGQPIVLTDEVISFIKRAYELNPNGKRKIRRAFISRSKGWAKSELAGMLSVVEALGPVRFAGFDANGEPVGRSVTAPEILCVATEEGQADNTYGNVHYMLRHLADKHGDEFPGLDPGLGRSYTGGGGEIAPVTAKARSKDGGKSTFVTFDETHQYEADELRRMHTTILRNLGKRKIAEPWSLETSTMYRPGMNSTAEATHNYARAIQTGKLRDDSLLFDHRQGPADFDWNNDDELRGALGKAYGDAAQWMDFDRIIAEIRDPQSDEADSRRYWLNQVVQATEQAFDAPKWRQLARPTTVVPDKTLITLGFDGARYRDSTALIGTVIESGHQFVVGLWEKPGTPGDWEVDADDVEAAVDHAFRTFDVWRMYADPPYWETHVNAWAGRYGDKRVVAWYTNRTRPMAYAVRSYANAIRAGAVTHDGDFRMAAHVANARRRDSRAYDEEGRPLWLIQKEHSTSPNKIDAAMAGCLSWEARGDAISSGVQRKTDARVFGF